MQPVRRTGLDIIRGITLISMIAYHTCWDLVYLYGKDWPWYRSLAAYVWQQSICWTFILLSGYCFSLGRHQLKRGLMSFGGGILVSLATLLTMPHSPIIFGVLTFLGSASLLMIPLHKLFLKVPAGVGLFASTASFFLLRNVNLGFLGFESLRFCPLPTAWYHNLFTTFWGFPFPTFISSDYFSIFPWFFLFCIGYFLYRYKPDYSGKCLPDCKPLSFLGRHSLVVYLLHQPLIYAILYLLHL